VSPLDRSLLSEDGESQAIQKISIPGYEIQGELGRGGMGIVYRARDLKLGRLVALKTLRSDLQAEPLQLARFRAEAKALGRLQHPNIVQIYEVGEHDGCPYIALELVDGGNLSSQFGRPARLDQVAPLIEVLARAIHAAHRANIIHRDLKPANVLISLNGVLKITDFGLAKQLGTSVMTTQSGAILGTPSYMAPEQVAGKGARITRRTDVYALGAILYELITGKPPFKERTVPETMLRVLHDDPRAPHDIYPAVPRDLETICLKCLEKDPDRRYRSALALAEDLRRFQAARPIKAEGQVVLDRAGRWCGRHAGLVGFVAGALLTAAFAVGPALMVYALSPLIFAAFCFMAKVGRATKLGLAFLYLETWALAWISLSWVAPAQALFSLLLVLIVIHGDYAKGRIR
jgi:serine/threonine protein kinase